MRVLRYLITAFFSVVVVLGVGFFLAREGLLLLASRRVVDSLEVLQLYAQRDTARTECRNLVGGDFPNDADITYQLRFLSSTEYVLEAVCPLSASNPIELGDNTLPMYVTKAPGKSGFVWTEDTATGIELIVFKDIAELIYEYSYKNIEPALIARSRNIVVADAQIEAGVVTLPETPGPTTSCEGFGYTCCDLVTQVGVGDQLTGLPQCRDSCYQQCASRPVILSFTSNPFFDVKTRQVEVAVGEPLTFSYVAEEKDAEDLTATIDFGDGEETTVTGNSGEVSHTYDCEGPFCTYTAEIVVMDENGLSSVETPISRLTVQVNR